MADQNNIYTSNIVDGGTLITTVNAGDSYTSSITAGAAGNTGPAGAAGATGPTGPTGPTALVVQPGTPTGTDVLWVDSDDTSTITLMGTGVSIITVASSAPVAPSIGDLWVDTT